MSSSTVLLLSSPLSVLIPESQAQSERQQGEETVSSNNDNDNDNNNNTDHRKSDSKTNLDHDKDNQVLPKAVELVDVVSQDDDDGGEDVNVQKDPMDNQDEEESDDATDMLPSLPVQPTETAFSRLLAASQWIQDLAANDDTGDNTTLVAQETDEPNGESMSAPEEPPQQSPLTKTLKRRAFGRHTAVVVLPTTLEKATAASAAASTLASLSSPNPKNTNDDASLVQVARRISDGSHLLDSLASSEHSTNPSDADDEDDDDMIQLDDDVFREEEADQSEQANPEENDDRQLPATLQERHPKTKDDASSFDNKTNDADMEGDGNDMFEHSSNDDDDMFEQSSYDENRDHDGDKDAGERDQEDKSVGRKVLGLDQEDTTTPIPANVETDDKVQEDDKGTKETNDPVEHHDTTKATNSSEKALPTSADIALDEATLRSSVDHLFLQVTDMSQVKVKEVMESIEVEHECVLTKAHKKMVRDRLVALIQHKVQPLQDDDDENEESSSAEQEEEEDSDASSVDPDSEDHDDGLKRRTRTTRRRGQTRGTRASRPSKSKTRSSLEENKPSRQQRQQMKKKLKAVRKQAELLRQRRLDELRIRNEELQAMQQDESRAERIAAKLNTNTDEQVRQRFEQRVQLVEQLAKARLDVIQSLEWTKPEPEQQHHRRRRHGDKENGSDQEDENENAHSDDDDDDDGSSSSSSDESEIEIVMSESCGANAKNRQPPVLFDGQKRNHALGLLKLADRGVSLSCLQPRLNTKSSANDRTRSTTTATIMSPTKIMAGGRAALRHRLKTQQRHLGNWWLARELNYTSVEDHVQDCKTMEEQKRQTSLQQEQARMQLFQQQWQKRLLERQGQDNEDDDNDDDDEEQEMEFETAVHQDDEGEEQEQDSSHANQQTDPEENEELAVAKELEQVVDDAPVPDGDALADDSAEKNEKDEVGENPVQPDTKNNHVSTAEEKSLEDPNSVSATKSKQDDHVTEYESFEADKISMAPPSNRLVSQSELDDNSKTNDDTSSDISQPTVSQSSEEPVHISGPIGEDSNQENETADNESETTVRNDPDDQETSTDANKKRKGPRNQAWRAMLQQDAAQAKKHKRRKAIGGGLIEEEADEEEEDQMAGLEDFGFTVRKKTAGDDDDDVEEDGIRKDDLEGVVDDLSDDEGDEEAGEAARKRLHAKEEKERHKEVLRRLREGYDGRRGGIGSGAGVRGVHRFDQLVAADNREDARRLGLLNDDELESDEDEDGSKKPKGDDDDDEEEDEAALVDKMLRDRFLHRSSVQLEENFSEDEEEEDDAQASAAAAKSQQEQEEEEQEREAKRFAKRARLQRLIEQYGDEEEFSQARLIDEDQSLKLELQNMKDGLIRKRSQSSSQQSSLFSSSNSFFAPPPSKRSRTSSVSSTSNASAAPKGVGILDGNNCTSALGLALQASRRKTKPRLVTSWQSSEAAVFRKVTPCAAMTGFSSASNQRSRSGSNQNQSSKRNNNLSSIPPASRASSSNASRLPPASSSSSSSSSLWSKAIGGKNKIKPSCGKR